MSAVLLGSRCLLAAVFLVAAVGKLRDRAGAVDALAAFGVPRRFVAVGAITLPLVELVAVVALVLSPLAVAGAALALALLALFTAAIGRQLAAGQAPACHCFGQLQSEPIGPSSIVRNGVLAAFALVVIVGGGGPSLTAALGGLDRTGLALVAISVAAALVAVFAWWLWSDRSSLQQQLAAAIAAQRPSGLDPGTSAPGFSMTGLDGVSASLADLLGPGLPVALVFLSEHCGPCHALLPSLGDWQRTLGERMTVAPVFNGDREGALRLADAHALPSAMSQDGDEVFREYRLRATPSAVLIDADGRIAAPPAEGEPAIEALIRSVLQRDATPQLAIYR